MSLLNHIGKICKRVVTLFFQSESTILPNQLGYWLGSWGLKYRRVPLPTNAPLQESFWTLPKPAIENIQASCSKNSRAIPNSLLAFCDGSTVNTLIAPSLSGSKGASVHSLRSATPRGLRSECSSSTSSSMIST